MWTRNNYVSQDILETLHKNAKDNIQRVAYHDLSVEEFRERFDKPQIPCIITGVPQAEEWNYEKNWTWQVSTFDLNNKISKSYLF